MCAWGTERCMRSPHAPMHAEWTKVHFGIKEGICMHAWWCRKIGCRKLQSLICSYNWPLHACNGRGHSFTWELILAMLLWNKCGLDNLLTNFAKSIYCTGPEWGGVETRILCTILLILASCHPVNFNHLRRWYKDDHVELQKLSSKIQDALFSNTLCFFCRALRSTSHGCVFPFWVRRRRPARAYFFLDALSTVSEWQRICACAVPHPLCT